MLLFCPQASIHFFSPLGSYTALTFRGTPLLILSTFVLVTLTHIPCVTSGNAIRTRQPGHHLWTAVNLEFPGLPLGMLEWPQHKGKLSLWSRQGENRRWTKTVLELFLDFSVTGANKLSSWLKSIWCEFAVIGYQRILTDTSRSESLEQSRNFIRERWGIGYVIPRWEDSKTTR